MGTTPFIQIKDLDKEYISQNNTVTALSGINLNINKGDIFGIIGMSGAGKSTLVRCINFLEKPTRGTVIIGDKDLSLLNEKDLMNARQEIGMIFQQFNLLMQRNVEDNICFPLEIRGMSKKEGRKRAGELLELVGLSDKRNVYPSQLSGGQKQRVAIARALATNPEILLCDEATSALDPTTTRSILALLKDINKKLGITIIIITHEMAVVEEICDYVAIIDNGRLAENGLVEEVFSKPKTEAAKKLVYHSSFAVKEMTSKRCIRIVFDGKSSFEPVIANMVLECRAQVNILFADTKDINGKAFGQMVLQLPEDEMISDKIIHYLKDKKVTVEELVDYVG
ncbi:MAG: ATP-binding cassette domain-containing protein [Sedimentibacter sp.]|uniref:methionine ABC transporter ATP-binding protein n=1 Tax=Sedimentibacter sp. TaxID=1960295 RepID=UPI002982A8FF|nr:ATP-binding cassette domain-containing protein [Sedimentibacter sp.]MDW5300235.1 ATP-binding cassette domain-containing protein [Sedimentibacter sp.]